MPRTGHREEIECILCIVQKIDWNMNTATESHTRIYIRVYDTKTNKHRIFTHSWFRENLEKKKHTKTATTRVSQTVNEINCLKRT